MPKKTLRQKMIAEKRKQHVQNSPKTYNIIEKKEPTIVSLPHVEAEKKVFNTPNSPFTKDLYKSIVISIGILLIEIGWYVAQQYGISITKFLSI